MFDIAPIASFTGRLLLGLFFLIPGVLKALHWDFAEGMMDARGLAFVPYLLLAAIVLEAVGGMAIITGYQARLAAFLLFFFTLIVNVTMHDFWRAQAEVAALELQLFVNQIAIAGGLLIIVGAGPGPVALGGPRGDPNPAGI